MNPDEKINLLASDIIKGAEEVKLLLAKMRADQAVLDAKTEELLIIAKKAQKTAQKNLQEFEQGV